MGLHGAASSQFVTAADTTSGRKSLKHKVLLGDSIVVAFFFFFDQHCPYFRRTLRQCSWVFLVHVIEAVKKNFCIVVNRADLRCKTRENIDL